jgi:hypothetical protein
MTASACPHINGWKGAMRVKQLSLSCLVCRSKAPIRIRRIALTSQHQLVLHCRCRACQRNTYLVQPLDDEATVGEFSIDYIMREPDTQFLRSMGVALPDEGVLNRWPPLRWPVAGAPLQQEARRKLPSAVSHSTRQTILSVSGVAASYKTENSRAWRANLWSYAA